MENISLTALTSLFNNALKDEYYDPNTICEDLYRTLQRNENYKDKFTIVRVNWSPYYFIFCTKDTGVRLFNVEVIRKKGNWSGSYFGRNYDWFIKEIRVEVASYNENVEQSEIEEQKRIDAVKEQDEKAKEIAREIFDIILDKHPECIEWRMLYKIADGLKELA